MPYYIYRILPDGQLEPLAQFVAFKDASAHAKALRASQDAPTASRIKVMFADTQLQAEDQLQQIRQPGPSGDD